MSNFDKKFLYWFYKYIFLSFSIVLFILGCCSHKLGLIHWGDCSCLLEISFIFIAVLAFFSLIFILYDISCFIEFIIKKYRYKKQFLNKLFNDVESLKYSFIVLNHDVDILKDINGYKSPISLRSNNKIK